MQSSDAGHESDAFHDAAVERIRSDHQHGASWLARAAARTLAQAVDADNAGESDAARLQRVHTLARDMALTRPSMAAIANTLASIWQAAENSEPTRQLQALSEAARAVDQRWGAAIGGMTQWARDVVAGPVYTLSRSGSVESVLATLARERAGADPLRVIVSESRPGFEGVALATALAAAGAQITLVVDGASAAFIEQVAQVIVGADSVRSDGSVVNKIGTHALALVARAAGKPVYALAESLKVTPASFPLVIEEMAPDELLAAPVAGITPRNVYFDVTPAALITAVVTESGPQTAAAIRQMAAVAERAYETLMLP
ncbi:MAG TPA: hypothetical protein VF812_16825 [Ktedonobacterales bacterium]